MIEKETMKNMLKNADDTREAYKNVVDELGISISEFCNALNTVFFWAE